MKAGTFISLYFLYEQTQFWIEWSLLCGFETGIKRGDGSENVGFPNKEDPYREMAN